MYQYSNSLIRQFPSLVTGNAAVGVQATVYVGETNTLASLFEVNGSSKSNPVTTDGKGFYYFSLADGDYRIVFSSSQFATLRISVLDGAAIREDFDDLVASNAQFKDEQQNNYNSFTSSQQAAYDSFVLSQGWDQVGTFAAGFTYTSPNQVGQDVDGDWWRWNGALPKTVTAGTLPSSDANYKLVGDGVLRGELSAINSETPIAGQQAKKYFATFDTVAEMQALVTAAYAGRRVQWLGYHALSDGGSGWGIVKSGAHTADGGSIITINPTIYIEQNLKGGRISVKKFGAKGDGVLDDRPPIQSCLDYVRLNGGKVFWAGVTAHYAIKTTHPDYPEHGLVLKGFSPQSDYKLSGCSYRSMIMLDTPDNITSLLYCPDELNHTQMNGLWFNANFKADYALKANESFMPFLEMNTCDFRYAIEANVWLTTYLATLTRVTTQRAKIGFKITGSGSGPVTSIVLNSCYALMARDIGFDFGYATYCTLNSCAVDGKTNDPNTHTALAYSFAVAYGVTMNACGSEGAKRYLKVNTFRGFTLNSPFMLSAGGLAGETIPYLIEFQAGLDATVSGLRVESVLAGGYTYKLGVTSASGGGENVTVLDNSIFRSEAYSVPNFRFEKPIKFLRGDESNKSETINISTSADLLARMSSYSDYTINHDIVLQLADGTYNVNNAASNIKNLKGSGTLTIQGNASNRASVKLQSDFDTLKLTNCHLRIIYKNLTVGGVTSNNSNRRMQLINATNVFLDNVDISRDGLNTGNAISMTSGSKVTLLNGSIATGPFAGASFNADSSSELVIAPAAAAPASGTWVSGNKLFNSTPTAGGNVGWVYTATGWKTFGTIGA